MKRMTMVEFQDEFVKITAQADGSDSGTIRECRDMLRLLCRQELLKLEEAEEA